MYASLELLQLPDFYIDYIEQLFFILFLSQFFSLNCPPPINIIILSFFCLVFLQYLFSQHCICFCQASQGHFWLGHNFYANFLAWCFYTTMLMKILSQDFLFLETLKKIFKKFFIQSSGRRKLFSTSGWISF